MFQSLFCSPNTRNSNTIRIKPRSIVRSFTPSRLMGYGLNQWIQQWLLPLQEWQVVQGHRLKIGFGSPPLCCFCRHFSAGNLAGLQPSEHVATPTLSSPYQILQRTIGLCLSETMLRSCLGLHNFRFLFLSHLVQAQSHNLEVNGQILDEITSVACFWSDE
jgi:hypothetical protein